MDIMNHTTGEKCHLKYHAYSYFSRDSPKKVFFFLIRVTDRLHNKFSRSFFEIATPLLFNNPGNPVMHVFFYFDHSIMLRLQKHNSEAVTGGVLKKHFSVKFRKFFVYSLKTSNTSSFDVCRGYRQRPLT